MTVKQALVKALPASMQRRAGPNVKGGTMAAAQIGLGTDIGANQLLIRSVNSVKASVRKHIEQLHMEQELDLAAAEVEAAELAAACSSWSSQQAMPSPTQLSSQGRCIFDNTDQNPSGPLPHFSALGGHAGGPRSAPIQVGPACMAQAPFAVPGLQQVMASIPAHGSLRPPQRLQLHMSSAAASAQLGKRACSAPLYQASTALWGLQAAPTRTPWAQQPANVAPGAPHYSSTHAPGHSQGNSVCRTPPSKAPRWCASSNHRAPSSIGFAASESKGHGGAGFSQVCGHVGGHAWPHPPSQRGLAPVMDSSWCASPPQQHAAAMAKSGAVPASRPRMEHTQEGHAHNSNQ